MRVEDLQTQDERGRPQIVRMSEVLPRRVLRDDASIELRSGWFSGCAPLGFLFLGIAFTHLWAIVDLSADSGFRGGHVVALAMVAVELGLAFWMFSKRVRWKIDRHQVRRWRSLMGGAGPSTWDAGKVTGVSVVEQGTFSLRFQSFAPGIHLETQGRPIDLGGSRDLDEVRDLASQIATLLDVPLKERTREGIFEKYRVGRRRFTLMAFWVAIAFVALMWWLRMR